MQESRRHGGQARYLNSKDDNMPHSWSNKNIISGRISSKIIHSFT